VKATTQLIKALSGFAIAHLVCCMERTGIFFGHAIYRLHNLGLPMRLESSLQIKQSVGLLRGKNDVVDAAHIAEYSFCFRGRICLWHRPGI
jgi:transposase